MTDEESQELDQALKVWLKWRHRLPETAIMGTNGLVWPELYRFAYNEGLKRRWPSRGYLMSQTFWGFMWAGNLFNIGLIVHLYVAPFLFGAAPVEYPVAPPL